MRAVGPAVCEVASRRKRRRQQQNQPPHHSRAEHESQHEPTLKRGLESAARETQIQVAHIDDVAGPRHHPDRVRERRSRSIQRRHAVQKPSTGNNRPERAPGPAPPGVRTDGHIHRHEQTPPDRVPRGVDQYRAVRDRPSRHDGRENPRRRDGDQNDRTRLAAPTELQCGMRCGSRLRLGPDPVRWTCRGALRSLP